MKILDKELFTDNKGAVYILAFFNALAVGMINPVIATHLTLNNISEVIVGINSSVYFLAIIVGSLLLKKIMKNKNLKSIIIPGLLLSAISVTAFYYTTNTLFWFILRIVIGIGLSFTYVGTQTMLHSFSKNRSLGIISGIYSACFALGYIIGAVIGPMLYTINSVYPFYISSTALTLGAIAIVLFVKKRVVIPKPSKNRVLKKISYPLQSIFTYGFAEAIIINLLPVFLIEQSVSTELIGVVIGAFILGSLLGTIPVTYIADKIGRERTMGISMFVAVVSLTGIILSGTLPLYIIFATIAGIGVGPVYALALSVIMQNLTQEDRSSGNAFFNIFYSLGAAIGPLSSSVVMKIIGAKYLFIICLLLFLVMLVKSISINKNRDTK